MSAQSLQAAQTVRGKTALSGNDRGDQPHAFRRKFLKGEIETAPIPSKIEL
jgi:hypothetical protein